MAAGPAVVAGLAGLRGRLLWLPLAALAGMVVSDLSGLVLGETERIWLPFVVWLLPATASLPPRSQRFWLALSALLGDRRRGRRPQPLVIRGRTAAGSVAKARMPSANSTRARKPSSFSARTGLATTCRTSPIRYSPVTCGSGPPKASASARAMSPTVCGCPEATL